VGFDRVYARRFRSVSRDPEFEAHARAKAFFQHLLQGFQVAVVLRQPQQMLLILRKDQLQGLPVEAGHHGLFEDRLRRLLLSFREFSHDRAPIGRRSCRLCFRNIVVAFGVPR
jgi:hypothetical protein